MTDVFIVSDVFLNCKESSSIDLITKSSFLTTLLLNEWGLVYHASIVLLISASLPEEIKRHKQRSFNNKCVGQKTYWFMVWFRNVKKESFSNKFRFSRNQNEFHNEITAVSKYHFQVTMPCVIVISHNLQSGIEGYRRKEKISGIFH